MTVAGAAPDGLSLWKSRAERAEQELGQISASLMAVGPAHSHHIHYLFADLYLCTTQCWLAHLSRRNDSEFAYRVICHFLELYKTNVLDHFDQPLITSERVWRSYHQLARRQTIRSPIFAHLILVSLGARAHTFGDLGRAMILAERDLGLRPEHGASQSAEQMKIFGKISDLAFYDAALDYVALQHSRQTGWRRLILSMDRVGLRVLKPVWLPVFQRWRRKGYAEAVTRAEIEGQN